MYHARLSLTLSFRVHVKLFYHIISYRDWHGFDDSAIDHMASLGIEWSSNKSSKVSERYRAEQHVTDVLHLLECE